jgi:hypothetical protein
MAIHYIIGIGNHPMTAKNPGERYLDFMLSYRDDEVEKVKMAKAMIDNKLWKTKPEEALEAYGVSILANNWAGISVRARIQNLMVCHFTSDDDLELTREELELIVKYKSLQELKEAQIKLV